jgi:hypothetical protein
MNRCASGRGLAIHGWVRRIDRHVLSHSGHGTVGRNAIALKHRNVSRKTPRVSSPQRDLTLGIIGGCHLTARSSATAVVEGRDFSLNATTVGCSSDLRQDWTDCLYKAVLVMRSSVLQGCLNDIVGKRVPKKALHLLVTQKLVHNKVLRGRLGAAKALLDDVRAELVAGQLGDTVLKGLNNRLSEDRLVQVNDILDDIVAKRILNKNSRMLGDALDEPKLLIARCMVDAALKNTAAMSVGANLDTIVAHGIKDELSIKGRKSIEALLDDMVAVEVLDELDDSETQGLDYDVNLLRSAYILNHLLEGACTMLIERNADHILGSVLNQSGSLVIIAVL